MIGRFFIFDMANIHPVDFHSKGGFFVRRGLNTILLDNHCQSDFSTFPTFSRIEKFTKIADSYSAASPYKIKKNSAPHKSLASNRKRKALCKNTNGNGNAKRFLKEKQKVKESNIN